VPAIRDELYGEGVPAACWAVITERWQQLLFGFYPAGSSGGPPLALVVFLLAVMPVLFSRCRGSSCGSARGALPDLLADLGRADLGARGRGAGLRPGLGAWALVGPPTGSRLLAVLAGLLVPVLYWIFVDRALAAALTEAVPIRLRPVRSADIGGFTLSFIIGLFGITLSLPLGVLLALARRSEMWLVSKIAVIYIEVIRGVPLIVWLLTAQILLNYFLPPGTNFDILLRVVIMVTLFASAYIAEVVRGGLAALPRGQFEAGDSLGLDYWQSMRLIVLPQALKISIQASSTRSSGSSRTRRWCPSSRSSIRCGSPPRSAPRPNGGDLLGALHLRGGGLLRRLLRHVPLFHVARAAARAQPPIQGGPMTDAALAPDSLARPPSPPPRPGRSPCRSSA
jgi:general L-amino acid transport system permease protein